ncbi:MAG TPA: hypothetical protein VFE15_08350 [Marmoricola sp.]|nr:hypothetical protein [Marmoricola sp.]
MTATVPLPGPPSSVAARRVFSVNGVDFTVADLARRAQAGGRESFPTPSVSTARAAEEAFRRSRGLLTADRLQAWLATWAVDPDDFRAWTQDAATGAATASDWCALVCSGRWDTTTAELVAAAAAACELGSAPRDARSFDPAGWADRLVAAGTSDAALAAAVRRHHLDWTRLTTISAVTSSRGIAEELRLQVLSDHTGLRVAAERADASVHDGDDVLASFTDAGVRASLSGAQAGELVGPVLTAAGWRITSVVRRTEPGLEDPATRARAEATVRTDVITRAVARYVVA